MGIFSKPKIIEGKVIAKRAYVSGFSDSTSTWYYVTIEANTGERIELAIADKKYGLIAENDKINATYKGKRLLNFTRL